MNKSIKKTIRKYCPDIKILRHILNDLKLKKVNQYTVKERDVKAGENSKADKISVVENYSKKWPEYTKELEDKLNSYLNKCDKFKDRIEDKNLRVEVLFKCFSYGFMPDEYFVYELENKTPDQIREYISDRDRFNYVYELNDIIDIEIFYDKYKTYERFREYYKREAISIEDKSDFGKFCEFVNKYPVFVKKNVGLSRGESVELVDSKKWNGNYSEYFDKLLANGKFILEEKIEQSEGMSCFNRSSVNTIRCMTFMCGTEVKIGPCFLKVGQGNSFVDNGGSGGILIGIDNKTGKLITYGYDEYLIEYKVHPSTNVEFLGYTLPEWNELTNIAIEASKKMPSVKYIGWDFAHTNKGWVVVEGNGGGQFVGPQIVLKHGIKDVIESILSE